MTLQRDFGKRIKEFRESLFLSQENLAEKIGIHRNSLARIENGNNFVSLETLEQLRLVFGVEYEDLFKFNKPTKETPQKALLRKIQQLNDADTKYFLLSIDAYLKAKAENSKISKKHKKKK